MSLKIRLTRHGAKKRPFYHIVAADSHSPRDGRFIEKLGYYNPMVAKDHPQRISLNKERIQHWLGVGAQPSDRVARFLGEASIIPMPKFAATPKKSQPKAKAQERMKAQVEREEAARKAAEEAKAAPAPAPAPEPEPVAEEVAAARAEEAPAPEAESSDAN